MLRIGVLKPCILPGALSSNGRLGLRLCTRRFGSFYSLRLCILHVNRKLLSTMNYGYPKLPTFEQNVVPYDVNGSFDKHTREAIEILQRLTADQRMAAVANLRTFVGYLSPPRVRPSSISGRTKINGGGAAQKTKKQHLWEKLNAHFHA